MEKHLSIVKSKSTRTVITIINVTPYSLVQLKKHTRIRIQRMHLTFDQISRIIHII